MQVLSHRGYWKTTDEKNLPVAFERSFSMAFGTETDLRDLDGALVVSHDCPVGDTLTAERLFELHQQHDPRLPLALNIKADGLQGMLMPLIERFAVQDAFVFDMSVPDAIQWLKTGLPIFTRHSDVEEPPSLYAEAAGVWLDGFRSDWWSDAVIQRHLDAGKRVCIVSPDLHKREHRPVWEALLASDVRQSDDVMLCTDFPEEAREVFGDGD